MRRAASIANRLPKPVRRFLKRLPGTASVRQAMAGQPKLPPPDAGSLRPIVYLPTWARWDEMRQRPQFVIEAFANLGHHAYFVDPRELGVRHQGPVTIVPSLEDTPRAGVILYTHFAPVHTMFGRYDDAAVIYDILDDLSIYDADEVGMPEHRRVRSHHPTVMERADVVMASAPALVDLHRAERGDIIYVENGVDPDAFGTPRPRPADFPVANGPVVGYHGMIARWFDFALVRGAARALPETTFVLVGPVDPTVRSQLERLVEIENIHYLGPRPSDEIAGYVQSFDIGIVPFVVDELTRAVSPLKMYEYMAAGVPVVSTGLPVAVAHPLVACADDVAAFVVAVRSTLDQRQNESAMETGLRRAADDARWVKRLQPVVDRLDHLDLERYHG